MGERLPFADGQFDFISMGYGLRHVADLGSLFREFRRVLRPGGVACALEIARPDSAVSRAVLKVYLRGIAPLLSRVVGRTPGSAHPVPLLLGHHRGLRAAGTRHRRIAGGRLRRA